ncbi:hypothetical protein BDV96DRAFT_638749 [Lophiotrema nucula]|uniref:Uncharacterized protein n=1 Tax=Lophiotrema nucula TaxID=690887 RepID=A0A6A5YF68_9PLEO|nr:hypothetical protein BDV96DRAFT_638749 [Lophiotrema nucula]
MNSHLQAREPPATVNIALDDLNNFIRQNPSAHQIEHLLTHLPPTNQLSFPLQTDYGRCLPVSLVVGYVNCKQVIVFLDKGTTTGMGRPVEPDICMIHESDNGLQLVEPFCWLNKGYAHGLRFHDTAHKEGPFKSLVLYYFLKAGHNPDGYAWTGWEYMLVEALALIETSAGFQHYIQTRTNQNPIDRSSLGGDVRTADSNIRKNNDQASDRNPSIGENCDALQPKVEGCHHIPGAPPVTPPLPDHDMDSSSVGEPSAELRSERSPEAGLSEALLARSQALRQLISKITERPDSTQLKTVLRATISSVSNCFRPQSTFSDCLSDKLFGGYRNGKKVWLFIEPSHNNYAFVLGSSQNEEESLVSMSSVTVWDSIASAVPPFSWLAGGNAPHRTAMVILLFLHAGYTDIRGGRRWTDTVVAALVAINANRTFRDDVRMLAAPPLEQLNYAISKYPMADKVRRVLAAIPKHSDLTFSVTSRDHQHIRHAILVGAKGGEPLIAHIPRDAEIRKTILCQGHTSRGGHGMQLISPFCWLTNAPLSEEGIRLQDAMAMYYLIQARYNESVVWSGWENSVISALLYIDKKMPPKESQNRTYPDANKVETVEPNGFQEAYTEQGGRAHEPAIDSLFRAEKHQEQVAVTSRDYLEALDRSSVTLVQASHDLASDETLVNQEGMPMNNDDLQSQKRARTPSIDASHKRARIFPSSPPVLHTRFRATSMRDEVGQVGDAVFDKDINTGDDAHSPMTGNSPRAAESAQLKERGKAPIQGPRSIYGNAMPSREGSKQADNAGQDTPKRIMRNPIQENNEYAIPSIEEPLFEESMPEDSLQGARTATDEELMEIVISHIVIPTLCSGDYVGSRLIRCGSLCYSLTVTLRQESALEALDPGAARAPAPHRTAFWSHIMANGGVATPEVRTALDHLQAALPPNLKRAFTDIFTFSAVTITNPSSPFIKLDALGRSSNYESTRIFVGHYDDDHILAYLPKRPLCDDPTLNITLMRCDARFGKPTATLRWNDEGRWELVFPLNLLRDGPPGNDRATPKQMKAVLCYYFATAGFDSKLVLRKSWEQEVVGALSYITTHPLGISRAKEIHFSHFGDLSRRTGGKKQSSNTSKGTSVEERTSQVPADAPKDQRSAGGAVSLPRRISADQHAHIDGQHMRSASTSTAIGSSPLAPNHVNRSDLILMLPSIQTFLYERYPAIVNLDLDFERGIHHQTWYRHLVGTQDQNLVYIYCLPNGLRADPKTKLIFCVFRREEDKEKLISTADRLENWTPSSPFDALADELGLKGIMQFLLFRRLSKGPAAPDEAEAKVLDIFAEDLRQAFSTPEPTEANGQSDQLEELSVEHDNKIELIVAAEGEPDGMGPTPARSPLPPQLPNSNTKHSRLPSASPIRTGSPPHKRPKLIIPTPTNSLSLAPQQHRPPSLYRILKAQAGRIRGDTSAKEPNTDRNSDSMRIGDAEIDLTSSTTAVGDVNQQPFNAGSFAALSLGNGGARSSQPSNVTQGLTSHLLLNTLEGSSEPHNSAEDVLAQDNRDIVDARINSRWAQLEQLLQQQRTDLTKSHTTKELVDIDMRELMECVLRGKKVGE